MENIYSPLKSRNKDNTQTTRTKTDFLIKENKARTEEILKELGLTFPAKDFIYDFDKKIIGALKNTGDIHIFNSFQLSKLKKMGIE